MPCLPDGCYIQVMYGLTWMIYLTTQVYHSRRVMNVFVYRSYTALRDWLRQPGVKLSPQSPKKCQSHTYPYRLNSLPNSRQWEIDNFKLVTRKHILCLMLPTTSPIPNWYSTVSAKRFVPSCHEACSPRCRTFCRSAER